MSTYKYKSGTDKLEIHAAMARKDTCFLAITEPDTDASIYIPNTDIPTVALELLKAAGHADLAGYVVSAITAREAAEKAEAEAAEKKLQERRDALAKRFSDGRHLYSELVGPTPRKAIDAYIELQDKLNGASRD